MHDDLWPAFEFSSNRQCFVATRTVTTSMSTHSHRAFFQGFMKHPWSDKFCVYVLSLKPKIAVYTCITILVSFACAINGWTWKSGHFFNCGCTHLAIRGNIRTHEYLVLGLIVNLIIWIISRIECEEHLNKGKLS